MKKLLVIILSILMMSGCTKAEPKDQPTILESSDPADYDVLVPFDASPIRYNHGIYLGETDLLDIGSRLQNNAKAAFSVSDYYLSEGQVLTITRANSLLKREATDNPYGLNPPKDSLFDSGVGTIKIQDAVLVADIMEIDFYAKEDPTTLTGMGLAVVFNQTFDVNGTAVTVTDAKLKEYAETVGRKLERYIRTLQGYENITIYMALYTTQKIDATLPGHFFSQATFTAREGQFEAINEEWVFFPSQTALTKDVQTSSAFSDLRNAIVDFTPESFGTVGEGLYVDGSLRSLKITVTLQAKTYAEVYALTRLISDQLSSFNHENYDIIVRITSNFTTVALIKLTEADTLSVILVD